MSLWPIHPQPQTDELLSSWMIRVARGNGFKVHNFYADLFGRERQIWNRDIDHHAPAWLLEGLERHSGVSRERLEAMTLRHFESLVFERFNEVGNTRLLMPLSIFHRTRRGYGQQFCPLCLAEDEVPHLRRRWRLALVPVCSRHGVLLQDRCGACRQPLAPHRADMATTRSFPQHSTLRHCGHCRSRITALPVSVEWFGVKAQEHIDSALDRGYVTLPDHSTIYSHLYFAGLRQLMVGLSRLDTRDRSRCVFERADATERLSRLECATSLVEDWPRKFLEFCSGIKKPYTVFTRDADDIPYWLASVLRRHLLFCRARLSVVEAKAIAEASERITGRADVYAARLISGRDIDRVLARPSIAEEVADTLIASIDQETGEESGTRRLLLQRDKVMFLAARCMQLSVPQLLSLDIRHFATPSGEDFSFWNRIDTPERAAAMLSWYVCRLRPKFHKDLSSHALFFSCVGPALKANAVGSRFIRAVQRAGLSRTISDWKCWVRKKQEGEECDAHLPVICAPPLFGGNRSSDVSGQPPHLDASRQD